MNRPKKPSTSPRVNHLNFMRSPLFMGREYLIMEAMPPLSLKTKLTLLAVLPATLIAGTLGGWLAWRSYASLREQALSAQLALARTLASQADQGISQSFAEILFLSKAP